MTKAQLEERVKMLERAVRKLQKVAHEPFDFTHLVRRLEVLERKRELPDGTPANRTPYSVLLAERDALVAAISHLKRDPRDTFVRVGAFHGSHDDTHYVTFNPHDAESARQGNGEPRPPYAVRIASGG